MIRNVTKLYHTQQVQFCSRPRFNVTTTIRCCINCRIKTCDLRNPHNNQGQQQRMLISPTKNFFPSNSTIRSLSTVSSHPDTTGVSHGGAVPINDDAGGTITQPTGSDVKAAAAVVIDPKQVGEEVFQQYLTEWNELEKLKAEQERMKSEKMFQAWQRTQQQQPLLSETNDSNESTTTTTTTAATNLQSNKAGGVAVVRTLAREVSKNRVTDPIQRLEKRATHLLQIAALKYKHPKALVELANIELHRFSQEAILSYNKQSNLIISETWIRDNVKPCLLYYEIAGDAGISEGYYNLAHIYWDGVRCIIEPDRSVAMNYMQKAIHLGDIDAMFFVGLHRLGHRTEFRVDQLQKALQWIEQAAEQKHGGALQCLTVLYMRGCKELDIPPCTDEEFQRRLSLAIEHDDNGNAYWLRALSYSEGSRGYPMDIALWFNDMVKAAELGHANACLNAGVALFQGFQGTVKQDQERAFQYYQRAGELGNIEGWRNVVDCYATGQGVKQNIEMAKYIGETMIRPHDEAIPTKAPDDEEAFEENR